MGGRCLSNGITMVEQNIIYVTSQGFYPRLRNSRITAVVQGSNNTTKKIKWLQINGQPFDLTGATITATLRENKDGDVIPINGDITIVHATNGEIEWTPSVTDLGNAGAFFIQFDADFGGSVHEISFPASILIVPLDATNAAGSPPLVGIPQALKDCLEDLCRLIQITNDDMFIGTLTDYEREVLIASGREFTKKVGTNILGGGFLDGAIESLEIRTSIDLISGLYAFITAFPLDTSAGAFILDPATFLTSYFAGVVGDSAGTSPDKVTLQALDSDGLTFINVFSEYIEFVSAFTSANWLDVRMGAIGDALPSFPDDAAAGVGGVVTGQLWVTDGTGAETGGDLRVKQAVSPPVKGGGFTPSENPPATSNWIDGGNPDTTGDGTGTKWMSVGTSGTTYIIDFSNNNQFTAAPATATGVILKMDLSYTSGLGNPAGVYVAPKEVVDGGMSLTDSTNVFMYSNAVGAQHREVVTLPFGASQTLYFSNAGLPAGGNTSLFVRIIGWLS